MKQRLLQFIKTYLLLIAVFTVQKPLFMLYYHQLYSNASLKEWFLVPLHGLKLDASIAGYLTAIPGFIIIASIWIKYRINKALLRIYWGFISIVIAVIFIADLGLYKYWGFRLDSTPLFYLRQPKDAFASVGTGTLILGATAILVTSFLLYFLFNRFLVNTPSQISKIRTKIVSSFILLLSVALLFLPIRGGITVSTMNVGQVYFSDKMELNHAAINPFFSLMESLTMEQNFDKQYRFMDKQKAASLFALTQDAPSSDSIPSLFTKQRPNVIFIIMESFMSKVIEPLGGLPNVAVRLNGFCNESVLFTNFYANSFRTDRGLVSILSGYPAQPTTSIMKYPHKTQSLPSIPASLKKAGYKLEYFYGGDADFTNMRSFLISMGIEKIISDKDFPLKDRMSKWGAPDHALFNKVWLELKKPQKEPFLKIIQTSSSHEPFDVPCHRQKEPYLNAVAYTDSCIGAFVDKLKKSKYWQNTIIVMVPDHAMRYPSSIDNRSAERHQIPLFMIGGAIRKSEKITSYASQIDIAATLLSQLNINHQEFTFSKNILNPRSPHFAYFTFPNGFGMLTPDNSYIYDYEAKKTFLNSYRVDTNKEKAEAILQTLYDDLEKR